MEVTAFAMEGDTAFALNLCQRNLRFLRTFGTEDDDFIFPVFFQLVKAMLTKRKLTTKQQLQYDDWQQSDKAFYGKLLEMVKQKYVPLKK